MCGAYPVTLHDRREALHGCARQARVPGFPLAQLRVSGPEAPALRSLKTTTNSRNALLVSYSPAVSARRWPTSTRYCDDAGMAALTLEEIAAKIATAESGFAAATSQYDRNVLAQIRDEYKRYAAERPKQIAEQAAAASSSTS